VHQWKQFACEYALLWYDAQTEKDSQPTVLQVLRKHSYSLLVVSVTKDTLPSAAPRLVKTHPTTKEKTPETASIVHAKNGSPLPRLHLKPATFNQQAEASAARIYYSAREIAPLSATSSAASLSSSLTLRTDGTDATEEHISRYAGRCCPEVAYVRSTFLPTV
jgi:hypothetical protein